MQNPPPNPGYGAPAAAGANTKSAIGLDGNIAAALGYPIGVIAIINLVMEKENRFVRYHAVQSLIFWVAYIVVIIALVFINILTVVIGSMLAFGTASAGGGALASIISLIIWAITLLVWLIPVLMLVGMIWSAVKAYQGQLYQMPVIGKMVEKFIK